MGGMIQRLQTGHVFTEFTIVQYVYAVHIAYSDGWITYFGVSERDLICL